MEEHTVLVRDYILTVVAMAVAYNLVIQVSAHHAIWQRAQVFHTFLVYMCHMQKWPEVKADPKRCAWILTIFSSVLCGVVSVPHVYQYVFAEWDEVGPC